MACAGVLGLLIPRSDRGRIGQGLSCDGSRNTSLTFLFREVFSPLVGEAFTQSRPIGLGTCLKNVKCIKMIKGVV